MPAIFHRLDGAWCAERVAAQHAAFSFASMRLAKPDQACSSLRRDTIELMRVEPGRRWIAIVPDGFTHNGQRVAGGLRALAHGDLLAAAHGESVFFSSEEIACIEVFAGAQSVLCPRDKVEIANGQPVVRCPTCGTFFHQLPERNCWTYAPTCAVCNQSTALDGGLLWSPEAI